MNDVMQRSRGGERVNVLFSSFLSLPYTSVSMTTHESLCPADDILAVKEGDDEENGLTKDGTKCQPPEVDMTVVLENSGGKKKKEKKEDVYIYI